MYFDTFLKLERLLFVMDYESYNAGRRIKAKGKDDGGEEGNFGGVCAQCKPRIWDNGQCRCILMKGYCRLGIKY